jgi:hypothetical protein
MPAGFRVEQPLVGGAWLIAIGRYRNNYLHGHRAYPSG